LLNLSAYTCQVFYFTQKTPAAIQVRFQSEGRCSLRLTLHQADLLTP